MKVIKRGLYIIIFIISLFIINTNIKAYEIFNYYDTSYTEKEIFKEFSNIENFNINNYPKIYCTKSIYNTTITYCYAFKKDIKFLQKSSSTDITISNDIENCDYYELYFYQNGKNNNYSKYRECSFNNYNVTHFNNYTYSNFDFEIFDESTNKKYNKLDFSSYLGFQEPEINIKATNLLNFILDKTKNIYEVLISNEIFKFILSIPLIYLCFLVLSKIIKK